MIAAQSRQTDEVIAHVDACIGRAYELRGIYAIGDARLEAFGCAVIAIVAGQT